MSGTGIRIGIGIGFVNLGGGGPDRVARLRRAPRDGVGRAATEANMVVVDVRCARCRRVFEEGDRAALISGRIFGDTCTDAYWWCARCAVYTIVLYRDDFTGPETESEGETLSRQEGDRRVAIIRRCPEPGDERCRCEAHREYFGDWLD